VKSEGPIFWQISARLLLPVSPLCQTVSDDTTQMSTSYSRPTTRCCATLRTNWHRQPAHSICRRPGRPTPWFDAVCRTERRQCRRLERRYRRTRSAAECRVWVEACTRRRLRLYKLKNEQFWLDRLDQCGRSSSQLWRSFSPLLGRDCDVAGATDHTPENFAEFFEKKVNYAPQQLDHCRHRYLLRRFPL